MDTFTALTSGAYALTENFIYTRQALDAYLEHLRPDGIVNFSRPMLTPPRETLKLALTAAEALEALGAERPAEHIVVLAGKGVASAHPVPWAQTMIKRSPFTRDEVAALQTFVQSLGFEMVFDPFTPRQGRLDAFLRAPAARRAEMTADYPLDIRPATDDRPFFFQFYRWSDLWRFGQPRRQATPVAVTVIYAAFVQVTLLSALFILYPLYRTQRMVGQAGGRAGVFAYFGAVGLGFIMIEVALLQKFTVFLGGPAYSMAVTLFAILLTSGIGSFVSGRIPASPMTLLAVVLPLLAVTAVTGSIVYGPLTGSLLGLSHAGRCVAAVAMLAPLGLLMGMPFPTALRLVNRHRPELNAWAWGINACATVVGTVLCMMVSSAFGFSHAIQVGAVLYVVSLVSVVASHRSLASAPVPAEMEAATAGIVG